MTTTAPAPTRLTRRLLQLYGGLVAYGVSNAMLVRAGLGLDPWDVLHQGLARQTGISIGTWVIIVGAAVLLLWIPLRQRPGLGTVSNVVVIGLALDATLALTPAPEHVAARWAFLLGGIALNGFATGCYIGASFGPGPRDGLMTGLAARGQSIRAVRTVIELTVLTSGFLLGGTVGIGTVAYAVSIGPLAHVMIPLLTVTPGGRGPGAGPGDGEPSPAAPRPGPVPNPDPDTNPDRDARRTDQDPRAARQDPPRAVNDRTPGCDHGLAARREVLSRHRVSEGVLRYQRCSCGAILIMQGPLRLAVVAPGPRSTWGDQRDPSIAV
jgi:uncharacterized membrane protein YczE